MTMKTIYRRYATVVVLCFAATLSYAQAERGTLLSPTLVASSTTNYYFAKPNELTITVDIMGFVQRPGRYEISNTVNLVNLLALAGGPTADGSIDDVKITRIAESDSMQVIDVLRLDLEDLSKIKLSSLALSQGDVVQIDRTGWSVFRDGFGLVVSAAIITGAVAQIIYATKIR